MWTIQAAEAIVRRAWASYVDERHIDWTWRLLHGLYSEPHRRYHTIKHVAECLTLAQEASDGWSVFKLAEVRLALLWHDAVYVIGDKRNEDLSAELLYAMRFIIHVSPGQVDAASAAIRSTATHEPTHNESAHAVIDIDLSILGTAREGYERYLSDIRAEYAGVSDDAWRVGRAGFLARTLARKTIFTSEWGRRTFEVRARENMERELRGLTGGT